MRIFKDNFPTFIHWFGWTLAIISSGFYLINFIGGTFPVLFTNNATLKLFFYFLLFAAMAGCAVSFFRRKTGGAVMLVTGISMVILIYFTGGMSYFGLMLIYGLPYLLPGLLFLL